MSDILAATGWIGEHPATGADVAHLLLYPATDLDPGSAAKIALLAQVWGLADAMTTAEPPVCELAVDLGRRILIAPGEDMPIPMITGEWIAAASGQGLVVVSLTAAPLSAPTMAEVEALLGGLKRGMMWLGFASLAD